MKRITFCRTDLWILVVVLAIIAVISFGWAWAGEKEELILKAQLAQAQLIIMERDNTPYQLRSTITPADRDMIQSKLNDLSNDYRVKQSELKAYLDQLQKMAEAEKAKEAAKPKDPVKK